MKGNPILLRSFQTFELFKPFELLSHPGDCSESKIEPLVRELLEVSLKPRTYSIGQIAR